MEDPIISCQALTKHQNPGPDGRLRRDSRFPDTPQGISRYHESVLHQGRIERFFLDNMAKYSTLPRTNVPTSLTTSSSPLQPLVVERAILPLSIDLDEPLAEDPSAYPITLKLRHLSEEEAAPEQSIAGQGKAGDGLFRSNLSPDDTEELTKRTSGMEGREEVVKAKYVIGCDGAHSWVRKQLGFRLEGEPTDYIWGVLDVVPITNFREFWMIASPLPLHFPAVGSPCFSSPSRSFLPPSSVQRVLL